MSAHLSRFSLNILCLHFTRNDWILRFIGNVNGNAVKCTEPTWVSRVNIISQIFWNTRRELSDDVFSGFPAVKVLSPYYHDQEDKNIDISSAKELDEYLMLLSSFFTSHRLCVGTYPSTLSCWPTPANLLDIYKSCCFVTFGIHLDTCSSNFLDYWHINGCSCL